MNFGLKTLLIGLTVFGAVVGLMGKLLLESPEKFLRVLELFSTVGPFLMAICTIAWLGLRGKRHRSKAVCAQCRLDLRGIDSNSASRCPACAADLTRENAIRLARDSGVRKGLVLWAGILLLTPLAVQAGMALLLPSGNPLRLLSNSRLIRIRLPTQVDQPWLWRELERRLAAGELTQAEVDDAIGELITHMKTAKPGGWNQPLAWQRDFLVGAQQAQLVSEGVLLDLYDAFYGPGPTVNPFPAMDEGQLGFPLSLQYGNPWSDNSGLNVDLLWNVKRVLLDGKAVRVRQEHQFGNHWSGFCEGDLEPGEHQVTIEIEAAYVDPNKLLGINKSEIPIDRWPKARKRWSKSIDVTLKVDSLSEG